MQTQTVSKTQNKTRTGLTWLLLAIVVLLAVVPLFLHPDAEFGGADDAASGLIEQIQPGTQPWFHSLWTPPSGEVASLLFAVQAALGAGVIGYVIGLKRGERKSR